jgi:hypothetical protein
MNSNLHIVTVATESKYYFPYLIESCHKNGKELEVIGMGEKWEGFNWKYKKMITYLQSLPKDDVVCFVDGYDVLCCRDLNKLIPDFLQIQKEQKCKIVVGHDKTSFMMSTASFIFDFFGKCKNLSINSGTYIGKVNDILYIIQQIYELNPKHDADDQVLMTKYCSLNPNDFYIDTDNKLFLALVYPLENIDKYTDIHNSKLSYNHNSPFFIHAPGYGILDNVITKLGYSYNSNIKDEYYKYFLGNKVLLYTKMIFFDYYYLFILLLVVLLLSILFIIFRKRIFKGIKPMKNSILNQKGGFKSSTV